MSSRQRVPALALIVVLLVGGALLDRWARDSSADDTGSAGQEVGTEDVSWPIAAPASARSSAWFCTGATSAPGGGADGTVVIANAGDKAVVASVTSIPMTGEGKQATLSVPASGQASQRLVDLANAPFAAAIVELDGGEAVVELVATGPLGTSVTPCASSASPTWYFAEGVTTRDALEVLTILNPFPEDAVVDLSFTTEEGLVTPQALTGLSVRGRGLAAINVGEYVQRREAVSTKVSARTGRLVVGRLQTFDGTVGRKGMAVTLGAATPGPLWYFADGLVTEGLAERFQVYNPQTVEAEVELAIDLDDGEAEPLRITVPRESRTSVIANEETRIPKGVGHAVTARSTNGVDVVVERSIDGVAPSTRLGFSSSPGARALATGWALAAGEADDATEELLVFENPGPSAARVSIAVLADGSAQPVPGLGTVDVPAETRKVIRMADHVKRKPLPLVVSSTQPLALDRHLAQKSGLGLSITAAIPLRGRRGPSTRRPRGPGSPGSGGRCRSRCSCRCWPCSGR